MDRENRGTSHFYNVQKEGTPGNIHYYRTWTGEIGSTSYLYNVQNESTLWNIHY